MSGGYWDYKNNSLMDEIFSGCPKDARHARSRNPMKDPEISELVYDVFTLLHDADYYFSGDIDGDDYQNSIDEFKKKWFKPTGRERLRRNIDLEIEEARHRLYQMYDVVEDDKR